MITYVAQEDPDGCLVACCAMLVGMTYREARSVFSRTGRICEVEADAFADQRGFAYVRRYQHDPVANASREVWPPEPFAPIHWALVDATAGAHAVVMLEDGSVLDPWDRSRTTLRHPAYAKVHSVTGLWRR